MQATPLKLAFLGLGLMGRPMATRLVRAGLRVSVWNRSPGPADDLASEGGIAADSPAQAAAEADIVCLCLTDATAVETVVFGPGGVAEGAPEGALLVDFSSIGASATRRLAERFARQGGRWLDAPVSGGVKGAEAGTLILFCGGEDEDIARARPVFEQVSAHLTHMGPVGAGQATKACNQVIVSANLAAIAEAVELGRALGVDVARLPDALKGGFADSTPLQIFGRKMVAADPGPVLGHLKTMLKDVKAAQTEAAAAAATLPLLDCVGDIYQAAVDAGLADADLSALGRRGV